MKLNTRMLISVTLLLVLVAAAAAEEVWVKRMSLPIREGKGAAFSTVATASKGDKLQVIAHEGKWLKVQSGQRVGYVYEDAISTREIQRGSDGGLRAALDGADTSPLAADAAAKGLEPQAVTYADARKLNSQPLQTMIARRNAITGQQWLAFAAEGKVGPSK
jgi:uncharacterized protein YgiM (DUF1202 family)